MRKSELSAMLAHDERHWWYRGRRRVLRAVLDRLDLPPDARLLDAGCGSGRELDDLALHGRVAGVDLSETAVEAARARGHDDVRLAAVERMPFDDASFDVVTCLDVVEHTPDDRATLRELRRVTRPGGVLVVTVPAYQALWSAHDVANRHFRRYRAGTLRAAAAEAGWSVVSDTHFNAAVLAPAALVRLARRGGDGGGEDDAASELTFTPRALDALLELPLRAEARLIGGGRRIPFGLSLLAVMG
jgi:2-polyprenyl-3-methyl-5-hydroxy-6-metoxy-1,4-benzoquinol methylase